MKYEWCVCLSKFLIRKNNMFVLHFLQRFFPITFREVTGYLVSYFGINSEYSRSGVFLAAFSGFSDPLFLHDDCIQILGNLKFMSAASPFCSWLIPLIESLHFVKKGVRYCRGSHTCLWAFSGQPVTLTEVLTIDVCVSDHKSMAFCSLYN